VERRVKAGARRVHENGADLADPRTMRDPGIDLGQDADLRHEARVIPVGVPRNPSAGSGRPGSPRG